MSIPLVFIPGFLPTEADFEGLLSWLAEERETHILLPSVVSDAKNFDRRVQDWFCSVGKGLPEHFYLFGYSMGGRISLALAKWLQENQPGRLQGLILEAAHPGMTGESERIARLKNDTEWAQRFRTESMPVVLSDWYAQALFADASERQRAQWVQSKSLLSGPEMAELLLHYSLAIQPDYRGFIEQSGLPVSYIVGDCDLKFVGIGDKLAGVKLLIAPECGHNIHQQNAHWLAKMINDIAPDK